ncbi:GNAT family N-acetyltransferase [Streptomyces sp. CAU 1734]|uniref:GNAT family N-acetyltransferase n=1 Tax=Streptomyces sp. CAU 1734 TaxID=3140360 RepID=UPI0032613A50
MPTPLPELPIRLLTRDDLSACADLSESRGWHREEHKWGLLLAAGTGYGIDSPAGKGLAAVCVVTSYGRELAALGMMLVAEEYARRGLGRRMMRQVLTEAGDTPMSLYATRFGRPLYEGLGFTSTGRAEMVRGSLRPPDPGAGTSAIRPATAEDLPAIIRLDTEVFGADRTHVLTRLPAFADHIRVAEENGELTGYAAAWPNTDSQVIGPLIARDSGTAQALITALAAGTDRPLRTDIDIRHRELLAWVKEHGMETIAVTEMMIHSADDFPGDWRRRFAPLTVAAG